MRGFAAILFLGAALANGQTIETRVLSAATPMKIVLSPALTTTLLFPGPLSGTFGLGLVAGNNNNGQAASGGTVQVDHPDGSNILVLHALTDAAHVLATVLLDGKLYVFDLQCGGPAPDVAVTLVKTDPAAVQALTVTPEQVRLSRIKYDPEILVGFVRRARDAQLLKPLYPDLYQGYASRQVKYTSDSGSLKTTVMTIHRFSKEDAIVLEGTVENETSRPIPANATVPINVVIQGDIDGGRANLAIVNEYRIILPRPEGTTATLWDFKNGGGVTQFSLRGSVKMPPIPLVQTGRPVTEAQR
jgi:hypothetical protein